MKKRSDLFLLKIVSQKIAMQKEKAGNAPGVFPVFGIEKNGIGKSVTNVRKGILL